MDDNIEAQTQALLATRLACNHTIDNDKTELRQEWREGSKGLGYYIYIRFYCVEGHHTDWLDAGFIWLPGIFETVDHPRMLQ